MAQGVYRRGVGQQICRPEEEHQNAGGATSADPSKDKEEYLQREAYKDQDLYPPFIPQVH